MLHRVPCGTELILEPKATTERRPRVKARGPGDLIISNPCLEPEQRVSAAPKFPGGTKQGKDPNPRHENGGRAAGPRPRCGHLTSASRPPRLPSRHWNLRHSQTRPLPGRGVSEQSHDRGSERERGQEAESSHQSLGPEGSVLIYRVPCHGGA